MWIYVFLVQKHLTDFPQPEDLCDYHRLVYHDHKPSPSPKQVAGAAAFEVRDFAQLPPHTHKSR